MQYLKKIRETYSEIHSDSDTDSSGSDSDIDSDSATKSETLEFPDDVALFKSIDIDEDGQITVQEMIQAMSNVPRS